MGKVPILIATAITLTCISAINANLEGPFLFWGPQSLKEFKKSALESLDQDDLIKIYEKQSAIVVFNNQDSVPLSGFNFPRLRKLLERKTILVLPQDFLDVHPDYINNETQVFTLQGPNSERDAAITETFNRLEDIYGAGRVLGVLGNSMSQDYMEREEAGVDCCGEEERNCKRRCSLKVLKRMRREKGEEEEDDEETTTTRSPADKQTTVLPEYALYIADASGLNGKAMLYSNQWPVLRYVMGEEIPLKRPLTVTVDLVKSGGKQYTKLVVPFTNEDNTRKIFLSFRFTINNGWWQSAVVEVKDMGKNLTFLLQSPIPRTAPSAVIGKSYNCGQGVTYVGANATLVFYDIKMQPFMGNTDKFSDSIDCIGYMTVPIWSGVLISLLMVFVLSIGITMMTDIKTNDKYDNSKTKALVITVVE